MKLCYWRDVAFSPSIEGEIMRNQHRDIPFRNCLRCSGYKSESKGCQYYEVREIFKVVGEETRNTGLVDLCNPLNKEPSRNTGLDDIDFQVDHEHRVYQGGFGE